MSRNEESKAGVAKLRSNSSGLDGLLNGNLSADGQGTINNMVASLEQSTR
jgi:hypothetical protein